MTGPGEMPFLDHLEELRWRIVWALGALFVGVIIGFVVLFRYDTEVLMWLQGPILPYLNGRRLMNTNPTGGFSIIMSTAIIVGVLLSLPVIIYQFWAFMSPALHRHEKRIAVPVIIGAVFLFIGGAALAWYFVLPMTLKFLIAIGDNAFDQMPDAGKYFGFVSSLVIAMGAVFELPILVLILSFVGIVKPQHLTKFRKHAVVGSYVVAAFITPGDLFVASVMLMVPLYLLYEVSIVLSRMVYRKKQAKEMAEAQAEALGVVP